MWRNGNTSEIIWSTVEFCKGARSPDPSTSFSTIEKKLQYSIYLKKKCTIVHELCCVYVFFFPIVHTNKLIITHIVCSLSVRNFYGDTWGDASANRWCATTHAYGARIDVLETCHQCVYMMFIAQFFCHETGSRTVVMFGFAIRIVSAVKFYIVYLVTSEFFGIYY